MENLVFYYADGKLQGRGSFTKNQIYGSWNYYSSGSLKAKNLLFW